MAISTPTPIPMHDDEGDSSVSGNLEEGKPLPSIAFLFYYYGGEAHAWGSGVPTALGAGISGP